MMSEEWVDPKADMCTDWFHEVDSDKGIWGSKTTTKLQTSYVNGPWRGQMNWCVAPLAHLCSPPSANLGRSDSYPILSPLLEPFKDIALPGVG